MLGITDQRKCRSYVFADLCRIHVHMYQNLVVKNKIRLADRTVRHAGTRHNNKIGFIHGTVGIRLSVVADHSKVQGMLCRHNANAHHGGNNRNPMMLRKGDKLFICL